MFSIRKTVIISVLFLCYNSSIFANETWYFTAFSLFKLNDFKISDQKTINHTKYDLASFEFRSVKWGKKKT